MANPIRRVVQLVLDRASAARTEAQSKASLGRIGGAVSGLKKLFGTLGLAIGAAMAVRKIVQFGNAVDESRRTLIRLTGATGQALRTLQRDTNAVFAQVPESIGDVSIAIGNLNTLLGVTGVQLVEVTKAALDFARANDVDVGQATITIGQLINRYGLSAAQAIPFMDRLTVAGQMTGASVNELAERLKESGPILSQLGFSINEQIALFSEFERRGIKGTEAAAGLNRVFTNLAREGFTDGAAAFGEFMRRIRAAPTDLAAGAVAAEAFGERAGAKMAVDIRAGAFEIDALTESLQNADGALAATEAASRTAGDEFKIAGNALLSRVVPAFQVFTTAIAWVGVALIKLVEYPIKLWQDAVDETILAGLRLELSLVKLRNTARGFLRLDTTADEQKIRNLTTLVFDLGVEIDRNRRGAQAGAGSGNASAAFDVRPESTGVVETPVSATDAEAARNAQLAEAERVTQAVRTATEIYNDTLANLQVLRDADLISLETFTRAQTAAKEALAAATTKATEQGETMDRVGLALLEHAQRTSVAVVVANALGNEFSALEAEAQGIISTMQVLAEEGVDPLDERFVGLIDRLAVVRAGMDATQSSLNTTAEIAQTAGDLVGAAFGGGIGPLAEAKARQNAVLAAEELAHAFAALANPFTAPTAGAHFAAAAKYAAVATAWKALAASTGGSGGGGGGAGGGGGGASFAGGGPGSQGSEVESGPEVHIHFVGPGFSAVNPQVQRVVAGALQQVQERFGENTRIRIHRGDG